MAIPKGIDPNKRDEAYFPFMSTGVLHFDPQRGTKHFDPWWALLRTCKGIPLYYAWFLKKYRGLGVMYNALWGSHVSVIKGQRPRIANLWGELEGRKIEFWYSNQIRTDNDKHAWLDVFSPEMSEIREKMGLPGKVFYHLTLGRLM